MFRKLVFSVVAGALAASSAQANCWTPKAVAAAQIRELDAMLMVSALRCRFTHPQVLARYNAFVVAERPTLQLVNAELKAHFAQQVGTRGALDAYDRFSTQLANKYGAGVDGLACDDMEAIVGAASGEGRGFEGLAAIAERADVHPTLAGGTCPVEVALRR